MKRFNIKSFIMGCAVTFGALSTVNVMADTIVKNATVRIDYTKLTINGAPSTSQTLLYNDTLYIPISNAARELGFSSKWDSKTNTTNITTGGGAKVVETPTISTNYSRSNPAPIDTIQTIKVESYSGNYTASVRVVETFRGDMAWDMIYAANRFNNMPSEGYEYILAKIAVTAVSVDGDRAVSFGSSDFDCYSFDNVEYKEGVRRWNLSRIGQGSSATLS